MRRGAGAGRAEADLGDSTGNGGHVLCAIDLPNSAETDKLIASLFKSVQARFRRPPIKFDTTTANPARIWRLYGTLNAKGAWSAERPHRLARILALRTEA